MHFYACVSQVYSTCGVPSSNNTCETGILTGVSHEFGVCITCLFVHKSFTYVPHVFHKNIVVRLLSSLTMMTGSGDSEL